MTTEATLGWLSAVGVVGSVVAITLAVNHWVGEFNRLTERSSEVLEKFNAATNALLDDDRTPMPIAQFVAEFSREIATPTLADWFTNSYAKVLRTRPRLQTEFLMALDGLPSDLAPRFSEAVVWALFLSAASKPLRAAQREKRLWAALEDVWDKGSNERAKVPSERGDPPLPETPKVPPQVRRAVVVYVETHPREHAGLVPV